MYERGKETDRQMDGLTDRGEKLCVSVVCAFDCEKGKTARCL